VKSLRTVLGILCVTGLVAAPASARDVTVWAPADYIEETLERELEALFESAPIPGELAWPQGGRNADVTRAAPGVLRISTRLVHKQVLQMGSLSFLAQSPATLTLELALGCRGAIYEVDARNTRAVVGGVVFQGEALAGIESQVETAILGGLTALDEAIVNATTGFGVPQQTKCVSLSVDSEAAIAFDFDLGCIEGSSSRRSCPASMVGSGVTHACVNRDWTVVASDCEFIDNK